MPWFLGVLLTVFVPLIVLNFYLVWKVSSAVSETFGRPRKRIALGLSLGLLILHALPLVSVITFWLAGREGMKAFSGESWLIDLILVYPFWTILIVVVQSAVLFLLWDIIRLIALKVYQRQPERWNIYNRRAVLGIVGVVVVYSVSLILIETMSVRVAKHDITIPDRFAALDGLTILHISDVQGDGRTDEDKVSGFVEVANELNPDFLMNSGDIVTSGKAYIARTASALSRLRARSGMFAVVGDHDIFSGDKQEVLRAMRAANHIMLEDTSIYLEERHTRIQLTFVTYTYPQKPTPERLDSLLSVSDSTYNILLVHQPAMPLVELAAQKGYDLFLAGHTHGGGVAFGLPGLGYLAPASYETRYVSGLYDLKGMAINVTNGLGFTLAPIRFHAPLEISLLTLRARGNS